MFIIFWPLVRDGRPGGVIAPISGEGRLACLGWCEGGHCGTPSVNRPNSATLAMKILR